MPEQHDPIDELTRFGAGLGSATPGGDMPRSAADVRRRGDQIRRRRSALAAGGAALAVAAVAVPVFALTGNDHPRSDRNPIAKDEPALAASDLLRDADTEYFPDQKSAFTTASTEEGDGQATFHPCQREALSALGAQSSFTRFYDQVVKLEPGMTAPPDVPDDGMVETIAQFPDAAAARAAYDEVTDWIVGCEGHVPGADTVKVTPQARSVEVGKGDAVVYDLTWRPAPVEIDPTGDAAYINETGLLLQGDRIAVLAVTIVGQDYNFDPDAGGTPVERMLPTAAERLLPGDGPDDDATPPTPEATATAPDAPDPAIPDDFPLTASWPREAGDGEGLKAPSRNAAALSFEACGTTLPDPRHAVRLTASYSNAEDYRTRQLTTYASADEAVAAVRAIRELYDACPTGPKRDDGYTPHWAVRDTEVGGESFAVLGWDTMDGAPTPYGDTLLVVRVGSAVLVVVHSGEGGAPSGEDDQRAIDQITQESAAVVARMCTWTVAGC